MTDDAHDQEPPTHAPLHRALSGLNKPKGILKNAPQPPVMTPGTSQHASLQWDEQNIALTEAEKERTTRMKITEPKTPFVHSANIDEDEIEQDIPNLDLAGTRPSSGSPTADDHPSFSAASVQAPPESNASEGEHSSRRTSFSSTSGRPSLSQRSGSGASSRSTSFSLPAETLEDRLRVHPGERADFDDDLQGLDAAALAKKRAFERARDRHYSHEAEVMKRPLQIEPDDDDGMNGDVILDDDDEDDNDEGGGLNGHRGVPPVPPLPRLNGGVSS